MSDDDVCVAMFNHGGKPVAVGPPISRAEAELIIEQWTRFGESDVAVKIVDRATGLALKRTMTNNAAPPT